MGIEKYKGKENIQLKNGYLTQRVELLLSGEPVTKPELWMYDHAADG